MIKKNLFQVLFIFSVLLMGCSGDEDLGNCTDGIQNGEETEIDCGGSCDACVTCDDGVQNGEETGIDCGGDCGLCGPPTTGTYFYGIIDGEEVIVTGGFGNGSGICSDVLRYYFNGGTWFSNIIDNVVSASVDISKGFPITVLADSDDLYAMYAEGSYPYTTNSCEMDGAGIDWADASDNIWRSSIVDQTGSTFKITSRGPSDGFTAIVEGEFSCKLGLGNEVKTLESGKFRFILGLF